MATRSSVASRGAHAARFRSSTTSVAAAVFIAIYGTPGAAQVADQDTDGSPQTLKEIIVTASRRQQSVEAVPYSISVVTPQQIEASGATDMASLAVQVPGVSMYDYGARFAGAVTPIIRGINATGSPARGFRTFEQSPVGTYIGNSPIDGYFQLDDIDRVEVLRGPQGTLYGAGALGGALRIIPNSPVLDKWEGSVEASGSRFAHSDGNGYSTKAMLNMPLGSIAAFRVAGKYEYDPGWIDVYGPEKRTNDTVYGTPLLANPADPIDSSPIYTAHSDWNWQRAFSGRASLLLKPTSALSFELALLHSDVRGDGGPQVNPTYAGGVSPFDPNATFPAGGPYQEFALVDEPFSRYTNLTSLDASYDAGFATVSSTSSYQTTRGSLIQDSSFDYGGYADGYYVPYYAGIPTNPRFIYPFQFTDAAHTFSQEVRLVSSTGWSRTFDYVVGVFYQNQTRHGDWFVTTPGSPERASEQGCTGPVYYDAAAGAYSSFPNCQVVVGPNDLTFQQLDTQNFEDKSEYGEFTWHFTSRAQATLGARHFQQQFTDAQLYQDFTFYTLVPPTPHSAPASKVVGKADVSYEFADRQYVYALWSQGFRRGGANSVPDSGPFRESPLLRYYQPDKTNNYETGIKGRFGNGLSYAFTIFDVKWDKPQISSSLPSGNLAVYNANTAESRGFEAESSGPLPLPRLSYSIGYSYVDAKLTSDFSLPANDGLGTGNIVPGLLHGSSGEQLPGSPKNSLSAALIYNVPLPRESTLSLSLNGVYRSAEALQVAPSVGTTTVQHTSSYQVINVSAAVYHDAWTTTLYVTNLFDKEEILAPPSQPNELGNLTNDFLVNPPREIGIRVGYGF